LHTILDYSNLRFMSHTKHSKDDLLVRVRRLKGQIGSIEDALETDEECFRVLQLVAACRGALNGLMAAVIEGHIRFHVVSPTEDQKTSQVQAAEELIEVIRTYLR